MPDSTFQFRVQAIPTIVMVLLAPLFVGLGVWQLERAEQKRTIASTQEVRRKLPALKLTDPIGEAAQLEYRKLSVRGRFLDENTVLIENRKHQGKTGYHVITPLRLSESGHILLVNRGWVPSQQVQQQFRLPSAQGESTIEGEARILQPPPIDLRLPLEPSERMPHWPFLTVEQFSAWSGLEVLPFVLLQAAEESSAFIRTWPKPVAKDLMHIGYAIQWFAFALITLMIWLRLSLYKRNKTGDAP
jgi:surfeit locus 1 family protein